MGRSCSCCREKVYNPTNTLFVQIDNNFVICENCIRECVNLISKRKRDKPKIEKIA